MRICDEARDYATAENAKKALVKALARIAVVTVTLAALVAGAPAAGADTTWTKISTDYNANIVVPSLTSPPTMGPVLGTSFQLGTVPSELRQTPSAPAAKKVPSFARKICEP